ncbi:MAG: 3-deoxy-manno-octulosonate cytidylyltransferase [Myxococcales bacterium]|nr:3-deoxy-manno-octulosonate cytidylyltransferase [Myxococcales bacterium]
MKTAAIIPARLASSRLPGKVLLPIGGKPMLWWVWRAACAARVDAVHIATADDEVAAAARAFGASVHRTRADHASGTDRVAEVAERLDAEIIINVQADEPALIPEVLNALLGAFADPNVAIASAMCALPDAETWTDPNAVKVVVDAVGDARHFWRQPPATARPADARLHVGLYAFRRARLLAFAATPPTPAERIARLEQLRALDHGWPIRMVAVDWRGHGVDTAADLARARLLLSDDSS